eukprot:3934252-Pleurochrysis_carterae.AAC.3
MDSVPGRRGGRHMLHTDRMQRARTVGSEMTSGAGSRSNSSTTDGSCEQSPPRAEASAGALLLAERENAVSQGYDLTQQYSPRRSKVCPRAYKEQRGALGRDAEPARRRRRASSMDGKQSAMCSSEASFLKQAFQEAGGGQQRRQA